MKIGNIFSFVCENWIYFWRKHWKMRQKSAHYTEFSNKEEKENSLLGKLAILCDLLLVETSIKDLNIFFHACRFYTSTWAFTQFCNSTQKSSVKLFISSPCWGDTVHKLFFLLWPIFYCMSSHGKKGDVLKSSRMKSFSILFHILISLHLLSD